MKNIKIYLSAIVFGVFAYSCESIEPTPEFKKSDASFAASASTASVAPSAADSLADVVTLTWNDPQYSVGLERSKFTVRVGKSGSDFSKSFTKDFTGVLSGSLLGKEINGLAISLGAQVGEPTDLDVVVVASQLNNNEPKTSAVVAITVTPYAQLVVMPSAEAVETIYESSSEEALQISWTNAFSGFSGVKTYQLQYAEGGTDFADPITVDASGFSHSFTHGELRSIVLSYGVSPGNTGDIDFRVKATNEFGKVEYSNITTVSVTAYNVPNVLYNSIGIVGDGTPGGWGTDTDLVRQTGTNLNVWKVIVYLEGNKSVKFRANDGWDINWGSAAFPSGTGTQNGDNIPVSTSGYYEVTFDAASGSYSFTPVTTTNYTSVSLIGAQTSWGNDIADLTQDAGNNQIWTGTVNLDAGELKFRANHNWDVNWGTNGTASSLSGYGVNNAGNMQITEAGTYFVYINVATGDYFFGKTNRATAYDDIGIVGNATAGGWSDDTNLVRNPSNPYKWSGTFTLTSGEAKFRANNGWDINWGATNFPSGVGTSGGPNIPIAEGGSYFVTFNSATGEYTFVK